VATEESTAIALNDATVAFRLADSRIYTAVEKARLPSRTASSSPLSVPPAAEIYAAQCRGRPAQETASGSVHIFDRPLNGLNREAGYLFRPMRCFWKIDRQSPRA
jgi:NitT/TauT family transport system ATP-binding protein